eukprot:GHVQ01012990.1.p1 GENE.GHVQ01012990.1~~GHVQ01012990.1.p1  ORF type:complete len:388 (+),score=48.29 GHVQ01012990.1:111-1166(+)
MYDTFVVLTASFKRQLSDWDGWVTYGRKAVHEELPSEVKSLSCDIDVDDKIEDIKVEMGGVVPLVYILGKLSRAGLSKHMFRMKVRLCEWIGGVSDTLVSVLLKVWDVTASVEGEGRLTKEEIEAIGDGLVLVCRYLYRTLGSGLSLSEDGDEFEPILGLPEGTLWRREGEFVRCNEDPEAFARCLLAASVVKFLDNHQRCNINKCTPTLMLLARSILFGGSPSGRAESKEGKLKCFVPKLTETELYKTVIRYILPCSTLTNAGASSDYLKLEPGPELRTALPESVHNENTGRLIGYCLVAIYQQSVGEEAPEDVSGSMLLNVGPSIVAQCRYRLSRLPYASKSVCLSAPP